MKGSIILKFYLDFGCNEVELTATIKGGLLSPHLSGETLCLTKKEWEFYPGGWEFPPFYIKRIVWFNPAKEKDTIWAYIKIAMDEFIAEAKKGIDDYNVIAKTLNKRQLKLIVKSFSF